MAGTRMRLTSGLHSYPDCSVETIVSGNPKREVPLPSNRLMYFENDFSAIFNVVQSDGESVRLEMRLQ